MSIAVPGTYDWSTLIFFPILAGVLVGIIFTVTLVANIYYRIGAVILGIVIVGVFIDGVISGILSATVAPPAPPAVVESRDAFTYDPGETATGVVVFNQNATEIPDQYSCHLKSANTTYINAKCECKLGYYGRSCEFEGFDENYVSLTTTLQPTTAAIPSITTPTLSSWPTTTTFSGCTNICSSNPACLAVTYANMMCTQYTSVTFPSVPIQTTIDPPVLDTTLYLNKSRLLAITFQGYFNIIYGVLPPRYFVGNGVSLGNETNIHVTSSGTRIGYYVAGVQTTFTGIPDWIIVGMPGTLRISPNIIPEPAAIVPGQGTLVSLATPLRLPKSQFPYTQTTTAYHVRLDP